jgi:hypothetical protein
MAYKSDYIIKQELNSIGEIGRLKLRIFPGSSREDQIHWVDGGLCFGKADLLYGSNDGVWYLDDEEWEDSLSGQTSNKRPMVAVEGTLALERGSSGNAQYQRFFHALGAVLSGVIGIYYLREGKDSMRYDLPMAALHAGEIHKCDYFITTSLNDVKKVVEVIGLHGISSPEYNSVSRAIKDKMRDYFNQALLRIHNGDINDYFKRRSIIKLADGTNIKYLAGNYRNFTESSQRGGHIVLGEFLLAKYFLKEKFYYLLPRLTHTDISKLDNSDKKEWKIIRADELGQVITMEELEGLPIRIKKGILQLKNTPLGGPTCGTAKRKWNQLIKELKGLIENGVVKIKK